MVNTEIRLIIFFAAKDGEVLYSQQRVHLVKAMVFPVVMYGFKSWTIKKADCQRIDTFELWFWRRLLSPLDCKERSNQVHPKGNQS